MAAKKAPKIYLAGPEVFLPDPIAIGEAKKRLCARHGLIGVFPLDDAEEPPAGAAPRAVAALIYAACIRHLDACDAVIANISPFRGSNADDGTAFEIGYAAARGKPLVCYDNGGGDLAAKIAAQDARWAGAADLDAYPTIEQFQLPVNLMLSVAALRGAGLVDGAETLAADDLSRFERAVELLAVKLRGGADRRRLRPL